MAKAKRGDKFGCAECGLVVVVDEGCGCATADIVCCGEPMVKGDIKTNKTKSKVAVKKAPKAKAAKSAKPAAKKSAAAAKKTPVTKKKVTAKKPAAKKPAAKKAPAKSKKK